MSIPRWPPVVSIARFQLLYRYVTGCFERGKPMKSSKTIFIGRNCHLMSQHRQAGPVMIVSLLMLLIMTLLGITAMNSTMLEEIMAVYMRYRNTSMQASEAALKAAEAALDALTIKPI